MVKRASGESRVLLFSLPNRLSERGKPRKRPRKNTDETERHGSPSAYFRHLRVVRVPAVPFLRDGILAFLSLLL